MVMPRSLNEPVGFAPSTLSSTRAPTCSESAGRVDERRVALVQRDDRRLVGDRQPVAVRLDDPAPGGGASRSLLAADDAQHRADALDRVELAHLADRRGHRRLRVRGA